MTSKRPEAIRDPSPQTLARYGMTLRDWKQLAVAQDWRCAVCRRQPKRLVIDHAHVPGFKHMTPEERKRHVRGLCCDSCNHFVLTRWADAKKHRQAAMYLDAHEARKAVVIK